MPINAIREFLKLEASAGILLAFAAVLALIFENSSLQWLYESFLTIPVVVKISEFSIDKPLLLWINDGLMALFFFLIGLEIKREVIEGQLSSREKVLLPAFAALGGLIVPALIYAYINYDSPENLRGWAIPAATDIAFALCIVMLLGKRVPESLKVCLVAIAILDDLAAILIIALFYTAKLSIFSLVISTIALVILFILNKKGVYRKAPYIVTGFFFWACILKSGVHATLAGVVLAMFIPISADNPRKKSPLKQLEHDLHPWVAYGVLPIFAFANAGVSFSGLTLDMFLQPITLGILLGLFLGKQIGIVGFTVIGKKLGICVVPEDISWKQYYGMALVCGIGFTMSLFIGTLAFNDVETQRAVRLGVLSGSFLSGLVGYLMLRACSKHKA
ncbi:MAG: Na+/H+ antiporter NhaA [Alphaproteobacteria bacterium]